MSKVKSSIKKVAKAIAVNKVVTVGIVAGLGLLGLTVPEEVVTALATIVSILPL